MGQRKNRRKYRPSQPAQPNQSRYVRRLGHEVMRNIVDESRTWYVVRTFPGMERRAARALRHVGLSVLWPVEDRWKIYKRRCSEAPLGYFGPYLFAGEERTGGIAKAIGLDGVAGILGHGSEPPQTVPAAIIQKALDDSVGLQKTHQRSFVREQRVILKRGPFAELVGYILELNRNIAVVSIDLMGKAHPVEVELDALMVA